MHEWSSFPHLPDTDSAGDHVDAHLEKILDDLIQKQLFDKPKVYLISSPRGPNVFFDRFFAKDVRA